jgi:uncharacterized membrane protein
MKPNWQTFNEAIRTSFWFLPGLMTAAATAAAFATVYLDVAFSNELTEKIGLLYGGGPEGAREVLGAIAGSTITVAGVVFSIMVVMLSLASQQFGPRILRSFVRDRSNQIVLGAFVATFVYCLLTLQSVREGDAGFVPHISVTLGILMAVLSIGVLIYFVHHAAKSIQSSSVIAAVGRELDQAIERLYPRELGRGDAQSESEPSGDMGGGSVIGSATTGYVQYVDGDELLGVAEGEDLIIAVNASPGSFVGVGDALATVHPEQRAGDSICRAISRAFVVAENRTSNQDVEFLFRQLTEIAVRALSPGINDPFTALETLDRLSAALGKMAGREIPSRYRRGRDGKTRLIAEPARFPQVAEMSLGAIRRYGEVHEEVVLRLLKCIRLTAPHVKRAEDRDALIQETRRTLAMAARWQDEWARRRIEYEARETLASLGG